MAYKVQTLPPGAYVFRVDHWVREKQSQSGFRLMDFVVQLTWGKPTTLELHWWVSSNEAATDWRSLAHEWLSLPTAVPGRTFVFPVQRQNYSPVEHDRWRNIVGFPICEVLDA